MEEKSATNPWAMVNAVIKYKLNYILDQVQ